ncbi:MAG: sigma-70 family RNA polymerase sigma factor [Terriglobia bacterium]
MHMMAQMELCSDTQLVERCLGGDREAFARIVERYQGLVCALAYNAWGDISRSEDLAQETFLAAWRQLESLKDRGRLRQWLCGIARHLIQESFRRATRDPLTASAPLEEDVVEGEDSLPSGERVISKEEQAVLWRVLEGLPATYREPLILFYRQNQSVAEVAETLELSEDSVKQRLSRGRVMLGERVARFVETALDTTGPKKEFTAGVLAALPAVTASAKAAAVGATAAKGIAAAKAGGLDGLASPISFYFAYLLDRDSARSPERRRWVIKIYGVMAAGIAAFALIGLLLMVGEKGLATSHPALFAGISLGLGTAYVLAALGLCVWMRRQQRSLRQQEIAGSRPVAAIVPLWEYRSKSSLLGLPLIHIRLRGGLERGPVKAWLAVGDAAIGVIFAFGAVAIAPISFGGFAAGLLTLGGLAVGVVALGGFSFAPWALGMMAVGWQAFGACAAGWQAAQGGLALARDFAVGPVALAQHANNDTARAFIQNSAFFQRALAATRYAYWLNLAWLLPPALWWWQRKNKQQLRPGN